MSNSERKEENKRWNNKKEIVYQDWKIDGSSNQDVTQLEF